MDFENCGIRGHWLHQVAEELQVAAGNLEAGPVRVLLDTLARVPAPQFALEKLILRLLYLELLLRSHSRVRPVAGSEPQCCSAGLLSLLDRVSVEMGSPHHNPPGLQAGSPAARSLSPAARAKLLIDVHYAEHITLRRLAARTASQERTLERSFGVLFGRSIHRYLVGVRTNHALELLANTDLKIDAIALAVGFHSKRTLYKEVKCLTGLAPGEYRRGALKSLGARPPGASM